MEMLMLLVARSDPLKPNSGARIEEVIDELWPGTEAKDPKGSFDVNVHRLRKLLKKDEAIVISEGRMKLNRELVWCDAFVFESMAMQVRQGEQPDVGATLALYKGALFGKEKVPWAFSTRERIAIRFTHLVQRQGEILESAGAHQEALDVYERGIAQDNLVEPFYRGLMRCHLARGEPAEALRAYRRCREMLSIVLGLQPAPETDALRKLIPAGQS
jgi:LuxR family transcriptional regulator, maltose regulon positive regulatory protein